MENIEKSEHISADTKIIANTEIFNKQNDLMWEQVRHVSTVEAGTFVGWWLTKDDYFASSLLLLISSVLLFSLSISIRRYSILLSQQHSLINSIQKGGRPTLKNRSFLGIVLRGHTIARSCPAILILANLFIFTSSTIHYVISIFGVKQSDSKLLYTVPIIILFLILYKIHKRSKAAIKSALYYMIED